MAGLNAGVYAGFGVGQYNPYAYNPYAYAPAAPPAPAQAPPSPAVPTSTQHQNSGSQTIGGNIDQSGTFKGHGTGASIQGGFTASGSIS